MCYSHYLLINKIQNDLSYNLKSLSRYINNLKKNNGIPSKIMLNGRI